MFTCLYGFMRIVVAENDSLYVSPNITEETRDNETDRQDMEVNLRIVKKMFFFVFGAVVRTYGAAVVLPLPFRQEYKSPSYTERMSVAPASLLPESLTQSIGVLTESIEVRLSGLKTWAWKIVG
jgi:hypothetical protein